MFGLGAGVGGLGLGVDLLEQASVNENKNSKKNSTLVKNGCINKNSTNIFPTLLSFHFILLFIIYYP